VQLGTQKSDAIGILNNMQVSSTTRQSLLEWCRLTAKEKAEHVQVHAKYAPDVLRLEHQITKIPTPLCARCRKKPRAKRDGDRGRHPKYCTDCRKQVDVQMVKASMKKKPGKYRAIKRRSRKLHPRPKEHALGGKPLSARDMHGLGLSVIPSDLSMTNENDETRISKPDRPD
jgi:hypothetical protein